ncbi:hypothetical protein Moror_3435, partial [Moniliophthora roreri MCA 2997]
MSGSNHNNSNWDDPNLPPEALPRPAPLGISMPPPSAAAVLEGIPDCVHWNFYYVFSKSSCWFTVNLQYLMWSSFYNNNQKPPSTEDDTDDVVNFKALEQSFNSTISVGSLGGFHLAHVYAHGHEAGQLYPDFIVTKIFLMLYKEPRQQYLLAIINSKVKQNTSHIQALDQPISYLKQAQTYSHRAKTIYRYMVCKGGYIHTNLTG